MQLALAWNRFRYTAMAPVYDLVVRLHEARGRAIDELELRPGDRLLIVGAGTGADFPHIPVGVQTVAGDLTPAMNAIARRRAARLATSIEVMPLNAHSLPFEDASFDAILLHLIIAVVPNADACIREARRVLADHGRVSVLDKFAPDDRSVSWMRRLANPFAAFAATDVTRKLGVLADAGDFRVISRAPAALGGFFERALLKPGSVTSRK